MELARPHPPTPLSYFLFEDMLHKCIQKQKVKKYFFKQIV